MTASFSMPAQPPDGRLLRKLLIHCVGVLHDSQKFGSICLSCVSWPASMFTHVGASSNKENALKSEVEEMGDEGVAKQKEGIGVGSGTSSGVVSGDAVIFPVVIDAPVGQTNTAVATVQLRFPHSLLQKLNPIQGRNGTAYSVRFDKKNRYVLAVGSRMLNSVIREIAEEEGITLRQSAITDVNHFLQAKVEAAAASQDVWYRVAAIAGGVEIDLGDDEHTRIVITAGKVEVIESGSQTLFFRTSSMRPMAIPAAVGNLKLLRKYVNLDPVSFLLFTGWLSYTLAHAKVSSSKFPILVIRSGEGSGKSQICRVIILLIDPRSVGVQTLPRNEKDLAIATQSAHTNCYDNVRSIAQAMSDAICIAVTGGALTSRQLYSDAEQQVISLHGALVINGIPSFIDQPDLAQRCLLLHLPPIKDELRRSETDMDAELALDLPAIQRGLFDLIAKILEQLPNAVVTHPTRMIDFSKWLAAMELVYGAPAGAFQLEYCNALHQGQLDALLDNVLAAEILEFAEAQQDGAWSGTPAQLLNLLNLQATLGTQRSRDWPTNPIALSKRLAPLQTGLMTQGVSVVLSRGKTRTITVSKAGVGK